MAQKDDFDLQLFLPYLLAQAAEAASAGFQRLYKQRYGMLRTEWRVLFHLGIYGEMTARDIGARAGLHKTKISRAVAALETKRLLTRSRKTEDRRQESLSLTPAGRAVYRDLREIAEGYDARLVAGLSAEEAATLRRLLQSLAGQS
ncbi:MarR family winged helix-turn-helix transcriptional regulator [Aestuariicoccus sp. MJ-SS9]|uniref:MarR family winged helix-turn-helix transcriptional regulator n=1 Tax=Aestuariicoccus sp. MJ-SS9 TaxID=3079855 RepID=UPI002913B7E4|nr:MarR family transcriptional regulator [Aestuariicoccus sp. MJ-SS9]MDU8910226.1 MarR family transcriptional regulator [Aestuariicoccus sp. MJ-SS9]